MVESSKVRFGVVRTDSILLSDLYNRECPLYSLKCYDANRGGV